MIYRKLGKTDLKVSLLSLGGEGLIEDYMKREEATAAINYAIDRGINYFDTSPLYGNGGSETNLGYALGARRADIILATKSHARSYDQTMRLIESSLKRLKTDYLDLYQLHNLQTDLDFLEIFSSSGALRALEELKSDGVIKHLGVTAHKNPLLLKKCISEYNFSTALMALNICDRHDNSFIEEVLPLALRQNLGIIGMKVLSRGRLIKQGISAEKALHYVFNLMVSTVIVGIDNKEQLQQNIQAAQSFSGLSEKEVAALEDQAKAFVDDGNFFKHEW